MFHFFRKKDSSEKRNSERLSPEEICVLEYSAPFTSARRMGELVDFSLSGLKFATAFGLRKNDRITVYLYFPKKFPGPRSIQTDAHVVRVYRPQRAQRFRVGCKFVDLSPADKETLLQLKCWLTVENP